MVSKNALLVLVILGIFSTQILQTEAIDNTLIKAIANQLLGLWRSDNVEFLGNSCQYRITPKIKRWKLKYDGKFWCPGWAPFSGRSLKSSRSGSVEHAIRDFATKAVSRNLVTKDEVELWLQGYSG